MTKLRLLSTLFALSMAVGFTCPGGDDDDDETSLAMFCPGSDDDDEVESACPGGDDDDDETSAIG